MNLYKVKILHRCVLHNIVLIRKQSGPEICETFIVVLHLTVTTHYYIIDFKS